MSGFLNQFPYSDFHEMNLDWIVNKVKTLEIDMKEFKGINDIKYVGLWSIDEMYQPWSVVNYRNTAYISIKSVPAGIDITNSEYWVYVSTFTIDTSFDADSLNAIANKTVTNKFAEVDAAIVDANTKTDYDVAAESAARIAADNALSDDINAEASARAAADVSLGARIDALIEPITEDAEVIDIRTDLEGATYPIAGDAVRALESKVNAIQSYAFIDDSAVRITGEILTGQTGRKRTDYMVCDEGISVTYAGESDSANIAGIAFFDKNKNFISGYANNGTKGDPITVTTPSGTKFAIISLTDAIIAKFVFSPAIGGLPTVAKDLYKNLARAEAYLRFVTNGTNRSQNFTDITNLHKVYITDPDYRVALWYNNGDNNTSWNTEINISNYPYPHHLQLRRADNGNIAASAAYDVCKGIYDDALINYETFLHETDVTGYVDGDDGDDSNTGLGRAVSLKTISAAVAKGFKTILIKPGTYAEAVKPAYLSKITIAADKYYSNFDADLNPDPPKVIIDATGYQDALYFDHCDNVIVEDIEVKNASRYGFTFIYAQMITAESCIAHDIGEMGYLIRESNGTFTNCEAYDIGTPGGGQHHDGFNIHGTGATNFINCSAHDCEDDGISHHDACTGYIDGGEWYNCGKGGVASPTHGAIVDVRNIYSHNNTYGIYCLADADFSRRSINFTNCACKNNSTKDIYVNENYNANVWNCIYDTISSGDNINIL